MSTPALNPLVEKIRAKYPGAYDDMDDAALTKAVLKKYPQYEDLAAPPLQSKFPEPQTSLADKASSVAVNAGKGFETLGRPAYEVSAPGILMSYLQKHFPDVAAKIPKELHGAPIEQIPGKTAAAFALMGEPGESPAVQPRAEQPQAVTPQPQVAAPQPQAAPVAVAPKPVTEQPTIPFPPRGPVPKVQYNPEAPTTTGKPAPPEFDTNGIKRDIDEDKAIQDAMRNDLGRHGFIAQRQANREFAARNSMDTPKGVQIEQLKNQLMGGKIADIGASSIGNPSEPLEFPNGLRLFKQGGAWYAKGGQFGTNAWMRVTERDLRSALNSSVQSGSQDLTDLLQKSRDAATKK